MIVSLLLALDLILKSIIVPQNQDDWKEYIIIKDILNITPTRNIGAGFSILEGKTWFLICLTILFIVALLIFNILYLKKSKLYGISTALIMAGAIGNLVDRILYGYVRDFIYLKFINFPVFNVADMALTFGIILLLVYIIFYSNKKEKIDTVSQLYQNNKAELSENNKNNNTYVVDKNYQNNGEQKDDNDYLNYTDKKFENNSQKTGDANAKDSDWRWN